MGLMRSTLVFFLATAIGITSVVGCTTVRFHSVPKGAMVYLNEEPIGKTPTKTSLGVGVGGKKTVRFELPGYESRIMKIHRSDVFGPVFWPCIILGHILLLPLIGLFWGFRYPDMVMVELHPAEAPEGEAEGEGE